MICHIKRGIIKPRLVKKLLKLANNSDNWKTGCHGDEGFDCLYSGSRLYDKVSVACWPEFNKALIEFEKELGGIICACPYCTKIIRMRENDVVTSHKDELRLAYLQKIWSINVMLQPADFGGVLKIEGVEINLMPGDVAIYTASEASHEITRVSRGTLYMFSKQYGW